MSSRSKQQRRKSGRKPHNARVAPEYQTLGELLDAIANEDRKIPFRGREVVMTREEVAMRVMIERALDEKTRDVAQLLRWMARYPNLAATLVPVTVIRGAICNV